MKSVTRALDVLFAVARADIPPTVAALSSSLGLPRSTTHRILDTLTEAGIITRREPGRGFVVTPKLALATCGTPNTATLADMIVPFLHRLVAISEETSSLHVRVGDLRLCVAEVEGSRGIRWARGPGWSAPIWAGAVGRILLADLNDCELDELFIRTNLHPLAASTVTDKSQLRSLIAASRAQGWSASTSETVDCAAAVAAPVVATSGRTVAALSLYASADRLEHMESLVPELCQIAQEAGEQWDKISGFAVGDVDLDDEFRNGTRTSTAMPNTKIPELVRDP